MNHELNQESIESIPVQANEVRQILHRLAANSGMAGSPTPTIRDIAEATETSPMVIARILSDIRGEDIMSRVVVKVKDHEDRIRHLEQRTTTVQNYIVSQPITHEWNPHRRSSGRFNRRSHHDDGLDGVRRFAIFFVVGFLFLCLAMFTANSGGR